MGPFAKRLPHVAILPLLFVLVAAGCAHKPTIDDYRRIESDNTLTQAEKDDRIVALSHSDGTEPIQVVALAAGTVLLVGALIARRATKPPAKPVGKSNGQNKQLPKQAAKKPAAKPAASAAQPQSAQRRNPEPTVAKLPESQAEVDAIPEENQGVSFFTSRPLPINTLAEVTVVLGGREHLVMATPQEADQVAAGQTPRIRAFTVNGQTSPWYMWEKYDPYRDYWTAMKQEWRGFGDGAIACTITAESCPSRLTGYFASEDEDEALDEAPKSDAGTDAPE